MNLDFRAASRTVCSCVPRAAVVCRWLPVLLVAAMCGTARAAAPVINSSLTSAGQGGVAYSYTITATNTPTSFNATNLPGGLAVNTGTGVISGTPTVVGG